MMKKLFVITLALSMMVSAMSLGAGAAYSEDSNHFTTDTSGLNTSNAGIAADGVSESIGERNVTVYMTTSGEVQTTNVYAVSYSATELTFTYNMGGSRVWNPETLKYENASTDGARWDSATQEINVTNYSDLPVTVAASVDQTGMAEAGAVSVTATKKGGNEDTFDLESAYNKENPNASAAKFDSFEIKVDGAPVNEYTNPTKLATITLTVSKVTEP